MGEDAMVGQGLTSSLQKQGEELLRELDRLHLGVAAALWIYSEDSESWRLIIATPEVDRHGPRPVYRKIHAALERVGRGREFLTLSEVSVVPARDRLVTLMRKALGPVPGISGLQRRWLRLDGDLVDDAYIYRLT